MWGINTEIYLENLQMYIHYCYKRFEKLFHISDQFEYLKIFDNNIKLMENTQTAIQQKLSLLFF